MFLFGPESGRLDTAPTPWDALGSPALYGGGEAISVLLYRCHDIAVAFAGRSPNAVRDLVVVKPSDDPGKVCIPSWELPRGEQTNLCPL